MLNEAVCFQLIGDLVTSLHLKMRNQLVTSIRPDLSHLDVSAASPIEKFQNQTLRPIIKLQHEILVALVTAIPHFSTLLHNAKTEEDYKGKVIAFLKLQSPAKNQIIGMVAGLFTTDEWMNYAEHKSEYNKRIIHMTGERVSGFCWKANDKSSVD